MTQSRLTEPVIVLPGVTATNLRDEYPVQPDTVFSILSRDYARIALHPTASKWELIEPARVREDHIFPFPYGDLVAELRHSLSKQADRPVPVFPFAYDWRLPLDVTEERLALFVDEVIERTKLLPHFADDGYGGKDWRARVHLVGHSMGGLIIAGYLQKNGFGKVKKVATLGSPFRGSQEAPRKVVTGEGEVGLVAPRPRERESARATPSLYHLLPSYSDATKDQSAGEVDLYDPENWQDGPRNTLSELFRIYGPNRTNPQKQAKEAFERMLAEARGHRARLEKLVFDASFASSQWLAICGVGEETWYRLKVDLSDHTVRFNFDATSGRSKKLRKYPKASEPRTRDTGDGTVPFDGACSAFVPINEMVCVADDDFGTFELRDRLAEGIAGLHAMMPAMNLVQRLVVSHLYGRWRAPSGDAPRRALPRKLGRRRFEGSRQSSHRIPRCPSLRERVSAATRCWLRSAPAAWARCTAHAT